MRFRLFACEILQNELQAIQKKTPHEVYMEFLPRGLHDAGGAKIRETLEQKIQEVSTLNIDAVLLGYGLCNNGIIGLEAKKVPLVVPRAHDCITLLLGSRKRYLQYFFDRPGTFFQSMGWLQFGQDLPQHDPFCEWVEKYGEDNAEYLREELYRIKNYSHLAFIDTMEGYLDTKEMIHEAEEIARKNAWTMEILPGNLTLLKKLLYGMWDEDFLVVPPGKKMGCSYDEEIVKIC